jgi:hypothetical protein
MKTKQLFPLLLCVMSMVLFFSSCEKGTISERKSIKITVNTEVNAGAATYSQLSASEVNTFSGSANVRLSDIPELNGFDLSTLSSATVRNVTVGTSCTEPGNFYVENINLQTTGASTTVSRIVVGESVSNNDGVNTFVQTLINNLLSGNSVSISISGTTNVNPPGKIIVYVLDIDANWTSDL